MSGDLLTLQEVAALVGGNLEGDADPELRVRGVNTLLDADDREISFLANPKYKSDLAASKAAAVLLGREEAAAPASRAVIRVDDPYLSFTLLQRRLHPAPVSAGNRHATAAIAASAELADDVDVGPQAVIGEGVRIGPGSIIGAGCVIGDNAEIGEGCLLHPRSVVAAGCILKNRIILQSGAVIGSDGFGYAWSGREHLKIPQVGRVVLQDDVEIGANSCIDRGAIGDTVIGRGVKLDNLIQIGHNVQVGDYSIMASQVGISGSTNIGRGCQIGGQAGTAGHLTIGDGCKLAARTGVMGDLEAGGTYAGMPAIPHRLWLRISALLMKLPELMKGLR